MGSHIDKTTKYDTLDKYVKQRYKKVLRDQVRYDKYKKNMKIKDEEFTAEMKFIEQKLLIQKKTNTCFFDSFLWKTFSFCEWYEVNF